MAFRDLTLGDTERAECGIPDLARQAEGDRSPIVIGAIQAGLARCLPGGGSSNGSRVSTGRLSTLPRP